MVFWPVCLIRRLIDGKLKFFETETTMVMTLHNKGDKQLEGELEFPMEEGCAICGYAVDVNGTMVDGTIVEKETAR